MSECSSTPADENTEKPLVLESQDLDDNIVSASSKTSFNDPTPKPYEKSVMDWMVLCSDGDLKKIKSILNEDPSLLNKKDPLWGMSCLHWSIKTDNFPLFEYLIEIGADVNIQTKSGDTPLHYIERYKRPQMHNLITTIPELDSTITNYDNSAPFMKIEPFESKVVKRAANKNKFMTPLKRFFTMRTKNHESEKSPVNQISNRTSSKKADFDEMKKWSLSTPDNLESATKSASNSGTSDNAIVSLKRSNTLMKIKPGFTSTADFESLYRGAPLKIRSSLNLSQKNQSIDDIKKLMVSTNTLNPELAITSISKLPH